MPTPNESVALAATADNARPSRPQLACPDETTVSTTPQTAPVDIPERTPADIASPCPSSGQLQTEQAVSIGSPPDEKHHVATPRQSAALPQPAASPNQQSELSPTIDQKFSRQSLSKGPLPSPNLPFLPSPSYDISTKRVLPSYTSSFLRPGRKFVGKQTSDRSTYEVQVELKHVDMAESFLCGYLRIKGLTEDHPTLTTYFEGEMIGDKYSFQTRRPEWGSDEKNDFQHWSKFPAFRPLVAKAKKSGFSLNKFTQKENIFMRWKEYFLVPDHRVRQISGASFEGFYYICFNQMSGQVGGIYFHAKSERYQRLELKCVPERTFGCVEFR